MRRNREIAFFLIAAVVSSLLPGCSPAVPQEPEDKQLSGQIFLLGEYHHLEAYYQKEFEIWSAYYSEYEMRDLFIELPCYMAEYLNLWMQSDNDDFLNILYPVSGDTDSNGKTSPRLDFYHRIKTECPETVFHGTDVGHEYNTTGESFLEYLVSTGQADTEMYRLTQECMEQGRIFYGDMQDINDEDWAYRENKMVENFIREMENTSGAGVMGIYGALHTDATAMNYDSQKVPSMAGQLQEKYGDALHTRDLTAGFCTDEPYTGEQLQEERVEPITVGEKTYTARYLGKVELTEKFPEYQCREFWVLEDAYEDFRDKPMYKDDLLLCDNYPEEAALGQVFVIDYTRTDGSVERVFHRYEIGHFVRDGGYATIGFDPEG